jgi:hypothetical protein
MGVAERQIGRGRGKPAGHSQATDRRIWSEAAPSSVRAGGFTA